MRFHLCWVVALLSIAGAAAGQHGVTPDQCRQALAEADAASRDVDRLTEAPALYREAIALCEEARLSEDLEILVALHAAKSEHLWGEEEAALQQYEDLLQRTATRFPEDHPYHIEAIHGTARSIGSLLARGTRDLPGVNRERLVELYQARQELTESRYGPGSAEAVEAKLIVASLYLDADPARAERYAREALAERASRCGLYGGDVYGAMVVLGQALERQGKLQEAQELASKRREVTHRGTDCPAGCCDT